MVVVHERIGPVPALELIREVALRFPAVGVILVTTDASPGLFAAAMDSGARGLVALPLSYEDLASRVQAVAQWSTGVRRHLGHGGEQAAGAGGTVVTVSGAKGGVGATLTAVQLALAAQASGRATALVDLDLQTGDIASYLDIQFRRSVADLAAITDISPRVLADAVFRHDTGLALLLAPGEGERGEEVTDRAVRQLISALRSRYEVVVIDCGAQLGGAGAAAVETADTALLVTTPDVIAVRAAKRTVRMWDRLQIPQGRGDHGRRQPAHAEHRDPARAGAAHHRHRAGAYRRTRQLQGVAGRRGRRAAARAGQPVHGQAGAVGARRGAGAGQGGEAASHRGTGRAAGSFRRRKE